MPLTSRCLDAITTVVGALSDLDARAISATLTNPGSDFQREIMNREGSRTPIAIVRSGSWRIVSWAATHQWESMQTLECFTHPEQRRLGYGRAAVSLLVASGHLDRDQPVAVFDPALVGIAAQAGFGRIRIFGEGRQLSASLELSPLRWSPLGGDGPSLSSAERSHLADSFAGEVSC